MKRSKPIDRHGGSGLLSVTPMPGHSRLYSKRKHLYLAAAFAGVLLSVALPAHAGKPGSRPVEWVAISAQPMPKGQKHENRHAIDQLEDEWRNAILKSNVTVMDRLLAEDYLAITASGLVQTKAQTLANLKSGRIHITSLNCRQRRPRLIYRGTIATRGFTCATRLAFGRL